MKQILGMGLLISAAAVNLLGQAGGGAMTGLVRDASGAAVPGATVTISNEAKGFKRELETSGGGVFNAPSLVPAPGYSITVTKSGFAKYEVSDITIQVGQTVDLPVALSIAGTADTVEVSAVAPIVEDTKSGVTDLISQQQIDSLPINGRRADTFALLTPAVSRDGTFGLISFRGISAGNAFLTDGNYTSNSYYSENAGRTRISTQISQDAVQEFQVLSDGFSAEFGRAMGGIINTVTRSGGNSYHGTGFEFFRNRTLNATDRYTPAGYNPPEWRHQFGGTFGGPIKKDKLFFFSDFEAVKRNFPGLNRITTTQIADPLGNFVLPANCTATAAQCAAVTAFIQPQMNVLVPRSVSSVMGFGKVDYHLNDRNSLTLDLNVMHWRSPNGIQTQSVLTNGNMLGGNGSSTVETRYGKASLTTIISGSSLNDFRFGWFKDRLSDPATSDLWPSTGALVISVASAAVGAAAAYPRTLPSEQRFQFVDDYSWTRGAHSLKFGIDFDTTGDYLNQLFNRAGTYTYANLTNFAKDFSGNSAGAKNYTSFTQQFGIPDRTLRTNNLNFYAQDAWKPTRKLTINLGARYEKSFLPQPTITDPNYPQTGVIPSSNHNLAPRLGVAYALNDRTVIRGGFGLFFAPYITNGIDTLFLGNSKVQASISANPTQGGAPIFPFVVASASAVPAGTVNVTFAAKDFHNPYSEQGTFAIERQIGKDLDLTVSYIYSRGLDLITSPDVNLSDPTQTATYTILDSSGANVGSFATPVWTAANKIDSRYAHIYRVENGGDSWYHGLAVQLRKRMSHGLSAQVSYTWSHAIDDAQQSGGSATIPYTQSNSYNGNYLLDKGSSGTDQRHRAAINWLWTPTFTKGSSVLERYVVNGWELSTITIMASSQPTSGSVSVSGTQFTATPLLYTSSMNGSGGWNRALFKPVDFQDIDREYHVDARLARSLPFTERVKGQLIFEAFNVFNTQYNTGILSTAYTASGGIIKPQAGFGNGSASQGFPDGTNARRMQAAFRITF